MAALRSLVSPLFLKSIREITGERKSPIPRLRDGFSAKNKGTGYAIYKDGKTIGHVGEKSEIAEFVQTIKRTGIKHVLYKKLGRNLFELYVDGKSIKRAASRAELKDYFRGIYG